MIPSQVKNVIELVDDGTNFNNCFLNETSQFTCKVCGNTYVLHRNVFLRNMCTLSTNTACSQNKTLFSCEAYFILLGTWTLLWNKKLLMRFISDKPVKQPLKMFIFCFPRCNMPGTKWNTDHSTNYGCKLSPVTIHYIVAINWTSWFQYL